MMHTSIESEQSIIAAAMLSPAAVDAAQGLQATHFSEPRHANIWGAVLELRRGGHGIDPITLAGMLGARLEHCGGLAYLNALSISIPSAAHARRYAEIVREKAMRRELIKAASEALEWAQGEEGTSAEAVDKASALIAGVQRQRSKKAPRLLAEIALERTGHYERLASGEEPPGWPVGIESIDDALSGGARPGKVFVIAARPGVGKSSLSAQIMIELAKSGKRGLFLSQEMPAEEVADRAVANQGRISYGRILSGKLSDDDWHRASDMLGTMSDLPVWIDDQGGLTIDDIRSKAQSVPGLNVLVLDYIQLCAGSGRDDNRAGELSVISRGLKSLALDMGLVVVVLSQLNREVEKRADKRPIMSDLKDCGGIEQDADVIMFLRPVRGTEGGRLIGCEIAKNRQGRPADLALHFDGSMQRWTQSSELLTQEQERPARRGFAS